MSDRYHFRQDYIEGWYQMDSDLLLGSTAAEFYFDDPHEPEPVTKSMLADYMGRWDKRTRALGSSNQWVLTHEVRQDKNAILTDWEWWELIGSPLFGAAIVCTSDNGVLFERITYFDRNLRSNHKTSISDRQPAVPDREEHG